MTHCHDPRRIVERSKELQEYWCPNCGMTSNVTAAQQYGRPAKKCADCGAIVREG